jgi:hypothetical protein
MKVTFEDEFMPDDIDSVVSSEIRRIISERIGKQIEKEVPERIEEEFEKAINKRIEDFVNAKFQEPTWEVQPTKNDQSPAKITLQDKLGIAFNNYFSTMVDSNGKPVDHYSTGRMSRIDYMIKAYTEPIYKELMQKPIAEATAQLKSDLARLSSEQIKYQLKEMFRRLFTDGMFS